MHLTESDLKRFWAKVGLPDENGCMLWLAGQMPGGYGAFWLAGQMRRASRISLQLATVAPGDGLEAAHQPVVCHQPACVAPSHLRWATHQENMADTVQDQTRATGENHGQAKLSDRQVAEARTRYDLGDIRQVDLARQYGVSQGAISMILAGVRRG